MFALRPVEDDDLPFVLEWRNRLEVREKMYTTHEITREEHYAYFAKVASDPTKAYFVCVDEAGVPLGVVYFIDINRQNGWAFWGFYSGAGSRPGVGSQMEYLALSHAFDTLNLNKLNAEVLSNNEAVLRFHKKFGFAVEGVFKEHHSTPEGYRDIYRIAFFKRDWDREWREKIYRRVYERDQ